MSTAPVNLISAQVPSDPRAPVVAGVAVHALTAAVVARRDLEKLAQAWEAPGVYILLGTVGGASCEVYVGKARSLRKRLLQHRSKPKLDWWRAVAIKRDTSDGFHTAEIGYLEGRLAAELGSLPTVTLIEGQKDQDDTLPGHHLLALDAFVPSILSVLRVVGIDLTPANPEAEQGNGVCPAPKKSYTPVAGTVADLLAAGLLAAGTTLTAKRAGRSVEGKVTASGEIVVGGVAYPNPSKAAIEGLGVLSANGWITWRLHGGSGATLADLRTQLNAQPGPFS